MNALFIGRFQPFHTGHLRVIENVLDDVPFLYVGVGSAQYSHTLKNPFTFFERKNMIEVSLSDIQRKHISIIAIPDIHDPPHWVEHVQGIISDFDVIISNNEYTSNLFSEKGYRVRPTEVFERKRLSGKEIRRRMISNEPWEMLVPKPVAVYLKQIDAVNRLKEIKPYS